MAVETRILRPEDAHAFRRSVRAGMLHPETIEDDEWVQDWIWPLDRARAAFDNGKVVATLRSFPGRLTVPGGHQIDVGALTAVSTASTHRRRGILTELIGGDLRDSAERGEIADILIAAEYPIYSRFGYGHAADTTSWELDSDRLDFAYGGEGTVELVDEKTYREEAPAVFARVSATRPGMLARRDFVWDQLSGIRRPPEEKETADFKVVCRDDAGDVCGYARYTVAEEWASMVPRSVLTVSELLASTPAAEARLWRHLGEVDWVTKVKADDRPVDEVLPLLLRDGRRARQVMRDDFLWVRILDVRRALEARSYVATGKVVLEVTDRQGFAAGRFALEAGPDGASCTPTTASAELTFDVGVLGAAYLGGFRLSQLHAAGRIDVDRPDALVAADALLGWTVPPWCNTSF